MERRIVVSDAPNARAGPVNSYGVICLRPGVGAPHRARARARRYGGECDATEYRERSRSFTGRSSLPTASDFFYVEARHRHTNGVYIARCDKTAPCDCCRGQRRPLRRARQAAGDQAGTRCTVQSRPRRLVSCRGNRWASRSSAYSRVPATGVFCHLYNGVLAYRAGIAQRRQLVWVNRQGSVLGAIGEPTTDFVASPELSADDQLAVVFLQRTGDNDIWVIELARNLARRVTDGPPADAHPLWDPDGQHVVFYSRLFLGGVSRVRRERGVASHVLERQRLFACRDTYRQYISPRRTRDDRLGLVAVTHGGNCARSPLPIGPRGDRRASSRHTESRCIVSTQRPPRGFFSRSRKGSPTRCHIRRIAVRGPLTQGDFYVAPDGTMMADPYAWRWSLI